VKTKFWLFVAPTAAILALSMFLAVLHDTAHPNRLLCSPKPDRLTASLKKELSWPKNEPAQLCLYDKRVRP